MTQRFSIARATALAVIASGCIALSAPAFADVDLPPQGTLALHGADLTSPRAVARLERRLDHLATSICMDAPGSHSFDTPSERTCQATALKDGLAQIDSRRQQALIARTARERAVRLAEIETGHSLAQ